MLGDHRAQLRDSASNGDADLAVVLGRAAGPHGIGEEPLLILVVHERPKLGAGLLGVHFFTACAAAESSNASAPAPAETRSPTPYPASSAAETRAIAFQTNRCGHPSMPESLLARAGDRHGCVAAMERDDDSLHGLRKSVQGAGVVYRKSALRGLQAPSSLCWLLWDSASQSSSRAASDSAVPFARDHARAVGVSEGRATVEPRRSADTP